MKLAIFSALLLLGAVSSAPTSKETTLIIDEDFFPDELKVYEGEHDIVKIYVPLNNLNFDEHQTSDTDEDDTVMFLVQADIKNGEHIDQGLYVKKGQNVKKLLDTGRDIAAPYDDSKTAYFAAKDGLYVYDYENNEAKKYGNIDDNLIGITMGNSTNDIYVLSVDKKVYKVSEDGTKKIEMEDVKNAQQIVLDFANNLFYVDSNQNLYILSADGVKKVDMPENVSKITLVKPPFILDEGIPVVADKKTYTVHGNGTVEKEDVVIETEITAFSMEAALIQYYAHGKKVYEYNILALLLGTLLDELKDFLDNVKTDIQNVATRSRSEFMLGKA